MAHWLTRTCKNCGWEDQIAFTRREAAFGLYDAAAIREKACSRCGSTECLNIARRFVTLDQELLDEWGMDAGLTLMQQDEELLLAEVHYLPMILRAVDEQLYLPGKIDALLTSLCVLLYDHTVNPEEYSPAENRQRKQIADRVRPELAQRKAAIGRAAGSISGYIQEVVFPQIGLEKTNDGLEDGNGNYQE